MVEAIRIMIKRAEVVFGLYPTRNTWHRIKINPASGVGISLCGKRFAPRNTTKELDLDRETLCKFCERLVS